jgi:hypothetical protein
MLRRLLLHALWITAAIWAAMTLVYLVEYEREPHTSWHSAGVRDTSAFAMQVVLSYVLILAIVAVVAYVRRRRRV